MAYQWGVLGADPETDGACIGVALPAGRGERGSPTKDRKEISMDPYNI